MKTPMAHSVINGMMGSADQWKQAQMANTMAANASTQAVTISGR